MAVVKRPFRVSALTIEQRKAIAARYEEVSACEIAKEQGTTPATILRILREDNVKIRPRGFTMSNGVRLALDGRELKEEITRLQALGLNGPEISRKLGVSRAYLYKHFSFKDPANHPHYAALVEIRDTLAGVLAKQVENGRPTKKIKDQLAAMDFVLSIRLPKATKAVDEDE